MANIKRIQTGGGGGGSGYDTIAKGGAPFPQETTINFTGAGITVADNAGASSTDVGLAAGLNDIAGIARTAGTIINGNGSNFVGNTITASRAVVTNASNTLTASVVTSTELSYLSGATSNIQAQINAMGTPIAQIITTNQTLAINTTYIINGASPLTLTLPTTFTAGEFIEIIGYAGGWSIAQGAGQNILYNGTGTTIGAGGSLSSTLDTDSVKLYAVANDLTFVASNTQGNLNGV